VGLGRGGGGGGGGGGEGGGGGGGEGRINKERLTRRISEKLEEKNLYLWEAILMVCSH